MSQGTMADMGMFGQVQMTGNLETQVVWRAVRRRRAISRTVWRDIRSAGPSTEVNQQSPIKVNFVSKKFYHLYLVLVQTCL